MSMLTRDEILQMDDLKKEKVEIPEWKGHVFIRSLTGTERDEFEQSLWVGEGMKKKQNLDNMRAKLVALCVIDDKGKRLFSSTDAAALGGKASAVLDKLFTMASKLNGLGIGDVEDAVKKSAAAHVEDSV